MSLSRYGKIFLVNNRLEYSKNIEDFNCNNTIFIGDGVKEFVGDACFCKDGTIAILNNKIYFCSNDSEFTNFDNYTEIMTIGIPDEFYDQEDVYSYISFDEENGLIYIYQDNYDAYYDFIVNYRSRQYTNSYIDDNEYAWSNGYVHNNIIYRNIFEYGDDFPKVIRKYSLNTLSVIEEIPAFEINDDNTAVCLYATTYGIYKIEYSSDTLVHTVSWTTDLENWEYITIHDLIGIIPELEGISEDDYDWGIAGDNIFTFEGIDLFFKDGTIHISIYPDLGVINHKSSSVIPFKRSGEYLFFDGYYDDNMYYYEIEDGYDFIKLSTAGNLVITKGYLDSYLGSSNSNDSGDKPTIEVYSNYDPSGLGLPYTSNLDINEYITKLDTSKYISGYNKSYEIIPGSDYIFVTSTYFYPDTFSNLPNTERYGYYKNSSSNSYYARIGSVRIHNEPAVALIDTREGSGDFLSNYIVVHGKQTVTVEWTLQLMNASFVGQPAYSNINLFIDTYTRSTTYGLNSMDDNVILFGKWNKVLAELPEGYTKS